MWEDVYCETQKNGNVAETWRCLWGNVPSVSKADLSNQSNQLLPCLKWSYIKPTNGLGLGPALTNWITVQSSLYNAKRAADKDNRQQSRSQTTSWDLISGRLHFHLNQIRWLSDKVQKEENLWSFIAAWEIHLHCGQCFNTVVKCSALSLYEVSSSRVLFSLSLQLIQAHISRNMWGLLPFLILLS